MKKKIIIGSVVIILIALIVSATMEKRCSVISEGAARSERLLTVTPGYCRGNYELILTSREPTKLTLEEIEFSEVVKEPSEDSDETQARTMKSLSSAEYLLTSEPTVVKVDLKKELNYYMNFPEKQQDDKVDVLLKYKISKISK